MMKHLLDFLLGVHLDLSALLMILSEKWKACWLMSTAAMLHFSCLAFCLLMYLKMMKKKIFLALHLMKMVMHHQQSKHVLQESQTHAQLLQMIGVIAS